MLTDTSTSMPPVRSPLSGLSEMSAEHAASWERWRADGAESDRRTQAFMRGVAVVMGLGLAVWAVVVVVMR
jgi:FtsH-binding integral membrane protein